jgi:ketosteroid isomerase-like protein
MDVSRQQVALALFEALSRRDLSGIAALFDPDFKGQRTGNQLLNLDESRNFWQALLDASPDLRVLVLETFESDSCVAVRWRCMGTHRFALQNVLGSPPVAATQRAFVLEGTLIQEIVGGRIRRAWNYFDRLSLMEQLGLLRVPPLRH